MGQVANLKQDVAKEALQAVEARRSSEDGAKCLFARSDSVHGAGGFRSNKKGGVAKAIAASFESAISAIDAAQAALQKANIDRRRMEEAAVFRVPKMSTV